VIRNKKDYIEIFQKANYFTDEMKNKLDRFSLTSKISIISNFASFALMIYLLFMFFGNSNNKELFFIVMLLVFFAYILALLFGALANSSKNSLDKIFFNNFLVKHLTIAQSSSELSAYEYKQGEHINDTVKNPKNLNQLLIELAYQAFIKNAQGFIVIEQNENTIIEGKIRTSTIGKNMRGNINTNIVKTGSAILIYDIKKKDVKAEIDKTDIGYWYELLQKGAITEEEYNKKKEELL
jgi:hypothetical protein